MTRWLTTNAQAATPYFVIHRRTVRYWVPRVLLTAPLHPVPPATGPRCLIGEILGWDIQEVDWGCSRLFPVRMCNLFIFVHSSLSCRRITHSSAETFRKLSSRFQTQLARKVSPFFFFFEIFCSDGRANEMAKCECDAEKKKL